MGRWSRHPMGSDGALDAKCEFFEEFEKRFCDKEKEEAYYEKGDLIIKEYLQTLNVYDLRRFLNNCSLLRKNSFVIPYIFIEYQATPANETVVDYLFSLLDNHDDITGEYNYCSETDENGEILELKHIRIFKENFRNFIYGVEELDSDEGLFAAMFKNNTPGLVNLT